MHTQYVIMTDQHDMYLMSRKLTVAEVILHQNIAKIKLATFSCTDIGRYLGQ